MPGRNGGTLKRVKKGEVLNPKGRPKKLPALDLLIAEVLADEQNGMSAAEAILKVIRSKAIKGDLKAADMLLNRAYGKPKEHIDIVSNGETITGKTIYTDGFAYDEFGNLKKVLPLERPENEVLPADGG